MFRIRQFRSSLISSLGLLVASVTLAPAQLNVLPQELQGIGVDEKLGQKVNLELEFTGTDGYPHTLRSMFKDGKPVVLNLVYYRCPMLCNLVLNAQTKVLKDVAWSVGKEFDVITISITRTKASTWPAPSGSGTSRITAARTRPLAGTS